MLKSFCSASLFCLFFVMPQSFPCSASTCFRISYLKNRIKNQTLRQAQGDKEETSSGWQRRDKLRVARKSQLRVTEKKQA